MNKLVAIIIVNFNGYMDTVSCVKSILKSTYQDYKIILVENGSLDKEKVKNDLFLNENCDVILNVMNLGFSGGNNIGIKYAQKKYNPEFYLLLNNDTEIEAGMLSKLINGFNQIPKCGLMTGKILYYNQPDTIWAARGKFDFESGIADMPEMGKRDSSENDEIQTITFCTGCLMLIPKEIIDNTGLLDEKFFMYAEDTDYSCRVIQNGYDIGYCGEARIYHKVSASSGSGSKLSQYYNVRNNFYIIQKYSTNKMYGYLKRWYRISKQIISHEMDISVVNRAYSDFRKGIVGKVDLK